MAIRRRLARSWPAVSVSVLVGLLAAAGCSKGDFGDFAGGTSSSIRPGPSVTLAPGESSTSANVPGATTSTTTAGPSTTGSRTSTSVLPPPPPPSQPVVTGARTDATATGLKADPTCASGRPLIKLSWQPVGSAEQAVAVSARPDGLDSGNFTMSETLPASRTTYELREAQAGGIYYWRVLTRRGTGWAASETATFQGPSCPAF